MTLTAACPPFRLALAALAAAGLLATAATPSRAAFPGRDGKLVYTWGSFSESENEPFTSRTEFGLRAVAPAGGMPTTLRGCVRETGKPDAGDCSIVYGSPAASADGRWIAFDAGNRIALMRADGSGVRLLPVRSADDGTPAFAPSGKRIALSGGAIAIAPEPAPPRGLWISDVAGTQGHQLTANGTAPAWSTRNWIAFLRADGVYRVRPNGHGLRRLVKRERCGDVDWSPGGTKLAFTCLTAHSGGRLYVANGDGTHLRRVVIRYASPQSVAWAPSGKRLAVTDFDGTLTTIRPDGSGQRALVSGSTGANYSSGASDATWLPLP